MFRMVMRGYVEQISRTHPEPLDVLHRDGRVSRITPPQRAEAASAGG